MIPKACRALAAITLLTVTVPFATAQEMTNPEAGASEKQTQQEQQEQKSERTTEPLSLRIQREGNVRMPRRGEQMDSVRRRFGDPDSRQGPVGEPPITRWQYKDFVVIFEEEWVIDSVVQTDSDD